jgi:PilZ domain-containing protein
MGGGGRGEGTDMRLSEVRTLELRGDKRQPVHLAVWIDPEDDAACIDCRMTNVSEGGARITVAPGAQVPNTFTLHLGGSHHARRTCEVVWRSDGDVGVRFTSRAIFTIAA